MKMREYLPAVLLLACWHASGNAQTKFPVISLAVQQERDADRKLILETELQEEQAALSKAQANYSREPNDVKRGAVHRHEENIKALRRELGDRTSTRLAPSASLVRTTGLSDTGTQIAPLRREAVVPEERHKPSPPAGGPSSSPWVIFADGPAVGQPATQPSRPASMEPARAYPTRIQEVPPKPASQQRGQTGSQGTSLAPFPAAMEPAEPPSVEQVEPPFVLVVR